MKQLFRSFFSFSPSLWGRGSGGEAVSFFLLLLLFSCTQDLVPPSGGDGETVPVRLSIVTAPMQTAGDPMTRATTDKTNDELAVHKTWLLQFNGTAAASRLLKAEEVTFTNNALETELLHTDAVCRLYVVANSDCSPFAADAAAGNGISLADFEASLSAFAAAKTIDPTKGLPMAACQDFNPRTDAPAAAFTLKPLVAKLTFKLNIDPGFSFTVSSVTLKQVAAGASYGEVAAGEAAVRPAGVAYTGELDLAGADASAVTCYLPENLSGKNPDLKYMSERGRTNAPEKATYVEVVGAVANGDEYTYSFFLGDGTATDFNVVRNVHYNLTVTLNGANVADQRTEVVFTDLNADGRTANCYLVYDNESYYGFDATVMGNGATTEAATLGGTANGARIVPQPLAPKSAKVLWETGSVTGAVVSKARLSSDKTKVLFKTGTDAGNAVIAVYDGVDGTGNILWSWHIWKPADAVADLEVQKYVDNNNPPATENFFMMDRNLGATVATAGADGALGLYYQWGRKDPFPGAKDKSTSEFMATTSSLATGAQLNNTTTPGEDVPSLTDNAECLAYAIENPTTFIKGSGLRSDWIKDSQDNLWGNPWEGYRTIYTDASKSKTVNSGYGSKSIYDPCPVGYRVPPQDAWTALLKADGSQYGDGMNDSQSKWDATDKVWSSTSMSPAGSAVSFPASGYVYLAGAILYEVGNYGYYWHSSPYGVVGSHAGQFKFDSRGRLNLANGSSRTYGYAIRCVKELD